MAGVVSDESGGVMGEVVVVAIVLVVIVVELVAVGDDGVCVLSLSGDGVDENQYKLRRREG